MERRKEKRGSERRKSGEKEERKMREGKNQIPTPNKNSGYGLGKVDQRPTFGPDKVMYHKITCFHECNKFNIIVVY